VPERRGDVLIQAWTRKEAYVKGLGVGLRHVFNGFETGVEGSWRSVGDPAMSGPTWWVRDLPPLAEARLALATAGSQTEVLWFGARALSVKAPASTVWAPLRLAGRGIYRPRAR
jgi:hypothetical protein